MTITTINDSTIFYGGEYSDATITVPVSTKLEPGTILGEITASGKFAQFKSANTDGSQNPTVILAESCDNSANASSADFSNVRIFESGTVNGNNLIFDGSDTLTTIIADIGGVKTALKNNGVRIVTPTELSE